jgi:16S rRNA (cytidine1402-2'-O)-methyltransferase
MGKIVQLSLPIGNVDDMTVRVRKALEEGKIFLAEDTRVLKSLCSYIGINMSGKTLISYHDHSGDEKANDLLERNRGETLYVVSDAGSPYISDPAFDLVRKAIALDYEIDTFPGPSSVIAALELSGLAPIPFHFHGFLARDKGKKNQFYEQVKTQFGTHLFFEGVSRVDGTIKELAKEFPNEMIVVAREISKKFQDVLRFKGQDWPNKLDQLTLKGEFVIALSSHPEGKSVSSSKVMQMASDIVENGIHPKKISKLLAEITGKSSKEIYQQISAK